MPVISTNIAANSAVRYLNINSSEQTASLSKLASGSRISQASDDAAGLAISTRISSDVTALTQAATNASHGVSVLQTADGGASNISDMLQRMKSLASQSASGTVTDTERAYIQAEFEQLLEEVDGIASSTRYNGQSLLDGTSQFSGSGVSVIVGSSADDTINVSLATLTNEGLGMSTGVETAAVLTGTNSDALTLADGDTASFTVNGETVTLGSSTSTAAAATEATLTGNSSADIDLDTAATATFDVNGVTVTIGDAGSAGAQTISIADVITAINGTAGIDVTASDDGSGNLLLTSDATGTSAAVVVNNYTNTGTTETLDAADLGFSTATVVAGVDEVTGEQTITLADVVTAIGGVTAIDDVTASIDGSGYLVLTSDETGSDAEVTLAAFTGMAATDLGLSSSSASGGTGEVSISTQATATVAIETIDTALDTLSKARADIGAAESRFSFRSAAIATSIENLSAANSAIVDTDVAAESSRLASAKVMTQAAVAAAAQANQMPQDLLRLIQG